MRSFVKHDVITRSEWGAKIYTALQTILATAKQKGEKAFQTLANLMRLLLSLHWILKSVGNYHKRMRALDCQTALCCDSVAV
jgi:hypothetical protein